MSIYLDGKEVGLNTTQKLYSEYTAGNGIKIENNTISIDNNTLEQKQDKLQAGYKINLDNNVVSFNNSWTLYDELEITQAMIDEAGEEGITSIMIGDGITPLPNWATEIYMCCAVPADTNTNDSFMDIRFSNRKNSDGTSRDWWIDNTIRGEWGSTKTLKHNEEGYTYILQYVFNTPYNYQNKSQGNLGTLVRCLSNNSNPVAPDIFAISPFMKDLSRTTYFTFGSTTNSFKFPKGTKLIVYYR